jgi:hypothetical protein
MTGTKCDLFTHKSSRSYLNHLVYRSTSVPVHVLKQLYTLQANYSRYTLDICKEISQQDGGPNTSVTWNEECV